MAQLAPLQVWVLLLLAATGLACGTDSPCRFSGDERDILEQAIRDSVDSFTWGWTEEDPPIEIYVELDGCDADDRFAARLADLPITVLPHSTYEPGRGVEPGVLVYARELRRTGRSTAEVLSSHYCGPLCAKSVTLKLEKRDGRWEITGHGNIVVS